MIQYVVGDAARPTVTGSKIIVHCCNDQGVWGGGFSCVLSRQYPLVEECYRQWYWGKSVSDPEFALGQVQFVWIKKHQIWIANLIGQHGVYSNSCPISNPLSQQESGLVRYDAIRSGLAIVGDKVRQYGAHGSIHIPKVGAGAAHGHVIDQIINEVLGKYRVYVYTPPCIGYTGIEPSKDIEEVFAYFGDEEYIQTRMF